jgi:hypothetical protein
VKIKEFIEKLQRFEKENPDCDIVVENNYDIKSLYETLTIRKAKLDFDFYPMKRDMEVVVIGIDSEFSL